MVLCMIKVDLAFGYMHITFGQRHIQLYPTRLLVCEY